MRVLDGNGGLCAQRAQQATFCFCESADRNALHADRAKFLFAALHGSHNQRAIFGRLGISDKTRILFDIRNIDGLPADKHLPGYAFIGSYFYECQIRVSVFIAADRLCREKLSFFIQKMDHSLLCPGNQLSCRCDDQLQNSLQTDPFSFAERARDMRQGFHFLQVFF